MNQPRAHAALGSDPIRTIGRDELKAKLDRGGGFKLIMALNRWAFDAKHIPGSVHFDTPDELYAAVRPDDDVVVYCSNVDCLSSVALSCGRSLRMPHRRWSSASTSRSSGRPATSSPRRNTTS